MNDIKIKEVNNIIATEILLNTYGIDILKYNAEQVRYLIDLLTKVEPKLLKLIEKANENSI